MKEGIVNFFLCCPFPPSGPKVIQKVVKGVEVSGFSFKGHISSPIKGAQGNTEFLAHFVRNLDSPLG